LPGAFSRIVKTWPWKGFKGKGFPKPKKLTFPLQFFGVECACEACRSLSFSLESFITPILTSRAQAWATLKIPSALRDLESMIPQLTMFPEKTKGFRVAVATRYVYL
jgi:hypothetical protein